MFTMKNLKQHLFMTIKHKHLARVRRTTRAAEMGIYYILFKHMRKQYQTITLLVRRSGRAHA